MTWGRALVVTVFALTAGTLLSGVLTRTAPPPRLSAVPKKSGAGGFVGSGACRSCHPSEYASWERSYHRSMTTEATTTSVRAPLGGPPLTLDAESYALFEKDGRPYARVPEKGHGGATIERPLVLTTGSHHYQVYWFEGDEPRSLELFPFAYLLRERTLVPRREVFLLPAGSKEPPVAWERGCIQCHATGGATGRAPTSGAHVAPRASELGIACEACHGPGALHVDATRSPIDRVAARAERRGADLHIVNPKRLSGERSSEVCGRCHSLSLPADEAEWWEHGDVRAWRPGAPLGSARRILTRARVEDGRYATLDDDISSFFYEDGTLRVAGRELGDMMQSACFIKGVDDAGARKLSCLTCHSMHAFDDANDQLATRDPSAPCRQCHRHESSLGSAHTRHRDGSSGSACVACHMPRATYALLAGIRSHRIDRGRLDEAEHAGRPDACSLCHADKPRAWITTELLRGWKQVTRERSASTAPSAPNVPVALQAVLAGNAATRALYAYSLGLRETRDASHNHEDIARALLHTSHDPVAAVRRIAERSRGPLGADPSSTPLPPELAAVASQRDDRPITLSE